jgi:hypothetical protein
LLYRARARTVVTLRILAEECTDPDTRAILFHEVLDETERIFLEAQGAGLPVVLEHSELPAALRNDSIDAFRTGVARVIVSARSLIEGFNVPSADLGIIVASTGSVRQRIQSLGRLLRRKEGGRKARVYVLYIRGTGDEAIYEKADWEDIVGAERNRYFVWEWVPLGEEPSEWKVGLKEVGVPPRPYRPPCDKVNVSSLRPGDPYPGRTCGDKVRVDQQGNLRAADDRLLRAPREVVDAIVGFSPHRRAVVVPCGHVIARAADNQWVFLGRLSPSEYARGTEPQESSAITLEVMRTAGRRRIAQKRQRDYVYPRGPREVEEHLLRWVEEIEHETGVTVRRLAWDGNDQYWVDVQGETRGISLPPLQFPAP